MALHSAFVRPGISLSAAPGCDTVQQPFGAAAAVFAKMAASIFFARDRPAVARGFFADLRGFFIGCSIIFWFEIFVRQCGRAGDRKILICRSSALRLTKDYSS
jgi:hypothetical protein